MTDLSQKTPLNVHMYLTPSCNLSCTHCYYDAWSLDRPPGPVLSVERIRDAIVTICDAYDADFHVEGGEVFLRKDLQEVFDAVPPEYWKNVVVTTSGTLPLNVRAGSLRLLGDLRISVEGHTSELQRLIRGVSLKPVVRTLGQLSRDDVPFTMRITLFKKNYDQILEMIKFFHQYGARRFSFYEYQGVGRGVDDEEAYALSDDDMAAVLHTLVANRVPGDVEVLKLNLTSDHVAKVEKLRPELAARGFEVVSLEGVASLTINNNGDLGVSPWRITADRVADRFANLAEIDLGPELERRMQGGTLDEVCGHCSEIMIRYRA